LSIVRTHDRRKKESDEQKKKGGDVGGHVEFKDIECMRFRRKGG
jgi:hypothetical protein